MAMVGRPPKLGEVVPGFKERRKEAVSEVLQEALLSMAAPATQAISKGVSLAKLLRTAIHAKKILPATKEHYAAKTPVHLTQLMKVPAQSYAPLKSIKWFVKRGQEGSYSPVRKEIFINPSAGGKDVVWHEFAHAESDFWRDTIERLTELADLTKLPQKDKEEVMKRLLRQRELDQLRRDLFGTLHGIRKPKTKKQHEDMLSEFYWHYNPEERMAFRVGKVMPYVGHPRKSMQQLFDEVYGTFVDEALEAGGRQLRLLKRGGR